MAKYNNNFKLILLVGVIIVLLLFLTIPGLKNNKSKIAEQTLKTDAIADTFDLLSNISQNDSELKDLLFKIKKDTSSVELIDKLIKLGKEKKLDLITAYAYYLKGKLDNNIEFLLQSADIFLNLSSIDSNYNSQIFYSKYGKKSCDLILKTDPNNLKALTSKASFLVYIDDDIMNGVQILKDVEKKDSNYIEAQHLLMLLAIQSKQYEKAEKRLKKLISLQPENSFYRELLFKIETQQLK